MVETVIISIKAAAFILLITSFPLSDSCERVRNDDKLSLSKQPYLGGELKIDGYYYQELKGKYYSIYFLYSDGTIMYGDGGFSHEELIEHELQFSNQSWLKERKERKFYWGLFKIENGSIVFERWYPSSGGPLPVYVRQGKIANDTTFIITKSMRLNGSEERTNEEVYHFKRFHLKPDSTNNFIK